MKKILPLILSIFLFSFGESPIEKTRLEFGESKIDAPLLAKAKSNKHLNFIIMLKFQARLSNAAFLQSKAAKAAYVFSDLRQMAQRTQGQLIRLLEKEKAVYQAFYVVNAIQAKGDKELLFKIAALPEVKKIIDNPWVNMEAPVSQSDVVLRGPADIEWGIQKINADKVWELGYRGQGVTIGGQDTGYDWEHATLKEKYKGWNGTTADHNFNWHDAIREINPMHGDSTLDESNNRCGFSSPFPCDDRSHGTHTMGTMVGSDAENKIGVAPEAKWIACRNMERGYGTPGTYIECFEWFLAPTDLNNENPDPSKAPHVINNSWSCPEKEGCTMATFELMRIAVNNLKKAGTVVVVSAGNSGSNGCGSINTPSAIFEESFTVGASTDRDSIAGFSSRGNVTVDESGRIKPNVVAPGVGVRSSTPNGGFATWGGTSMAGPHVAGLVALMISVYPDLEGQVNLIEDLIEQTAFALEAEVTCENNSARAIPNATYGYGRIDALKAINRLISVFKLDESGLVNLFPNPLSGDATFEISNFKGAAQLEIFSASGQLLKTIPLSLTRYELLTIDLQDLSKGVYFYQLTSEEKRKSGKLIKL